MAPIIVVTPSKVPTLCIHLDWDFFQDRPREGKNVRAARESSFNFQIDPDLNRKRMPCRHRLVDTTLRRIQFAGEV